MAPDCRGDEDEGSLPRGRANREAITRENREISGCPPGVPPPDPFPLMTLMRTPFRQRGGQCRGEWFQSEV